MYHPDLLSDHISQSQAAARRSTEQARLLRLARPGTATFLHRWLANAHQLCTPLFGNTTSAQHHAARWATERCCAPILTEAPGGACCAL
jgi:hypothetical protein